MTNQRILRFALTLLTVACASSLVFPCTTFVLRQGSHLVVGHNFDWISGSGILIVNPQGLRKTALVSPSDRPAQWTSKYGSVTFNQVGRELPFGGMNEQGLVVEQMGLDATVYPGPDHRGAISACQWIQYQLDNCATIEEVAGSDTVIRIVDATSKFHFLICDRTGKAAVIEFLNGSMVCRTGKDLPVEALANSPYEESVRCFTTHGDVESNRSLYNFCTAAQGAAHSEGTGGNAAVDRAFTVLNAVSQGPLTKWSVVYDISEGKIHFVCYETPTIVGEQKIFVKNREEAARKVVDVKGWDFGCREAPQVVDVDCPGAGTLNPRFVHYSTEINKEYIRKAFTFYKGWGIGITLTEEQVDGLARYPESFTCTMEK